MITWVLLSSATVGHQVILGLFLLQCSDQSLRFEVFVVEVMHVNARFWLIDCVNTVNSKCSRYSQWEYFNLNPLSLYRAFFDHSMHSALPLGIYLATKFWMYTTWFYWFWNDILFLSCCASTATSSSVLLSVSLGHISGLCVCQQDRGTAASKLSSPDWLTDVLDVHVGSAEWNQQLFDILWTVTQAARALMRPGNRFIQLSLKIPLY